MIKNVGPDLQFSGRRSLWYRLWREVSGQNLTEYALILALLALAAVAWVPKLGCELGCVYKQASISIEKARGNIPPGQQKKCGC